MPSAPAQEPNWFEVGTALNGVKVYVDTRSLRVGDGRVRLGQRFKFSEGGEHPLSRVEQQGLHDRASRSVRTLRSVEFNGVAASFTPMIRRRCRLARSCPERFANMFLTSSAG